MLADHCEKKIPHTEDVSCSNAGTRRQGQSSESKRATEYIEYSTRCSRVPRSFRHAGNGFYRRGTIARG